MHKYTFFSSILCLGIIIYSCGYAPFVPNRHKKNLTYCYEEKNVGIDSLINTNGYFRMGIWSGVHTYGYGSHISKEDTNYTIFLFLKDGICVRLYDPEYIERAVSNTKSDKNDLFYNTFDWGCYRINADTIKAQFINHPSIASPVWMLGEEWFKVIDKNTLKCILGRGLRKDKKIFYDARTMKENTYTLDGYTYLLLPAKFIPVPILPSSDCWLKRKKWFWCDEKQYKEWRRKSREIKKGSRSH